LDRGEVKPWRERAIERWFSDPRKQLKPIEMILVSMTQDGVGACAPRD
jgi:hypothetical protein